MNFVYKLSSIIKKTVGWVVVFLLAWMVVLALLQLLLRWTLSQGIPWADIQLRQLLLWLALLGGVLAAAENRHIRIDVIEHYLSGKTKFIIQRLISIIAATCSGLLGYLSFSFITSEKSADVMLDSVFFGMTTPIWIVELIIPMSFWLMALYFLVPVKEMPEQLEGN
ncbi:TRAP transporter small permease subunit [bacterium]|nr:TRAP transporter small permease subunit [bacterium]